MMESRRIDLLVELLLPWTAGAIRFDETKTCLGEGAIDEEIRGD
jgi:hypothetical protein